MTTPTLLVPVRFPDPGIYPLSDANLDSLDRFDVLLLGYWELADGETAEAARADHETAAEAVLYEIAAAFSHAGASTDIRLEFGASGPHQRALQQSIVEEYDPDGVLLADTLPPVRNVLVPLRDDRHVDSVTEFVGAFGAESLFVVELYHACSEDEDVESGERMLDTVADRLFSRGFSESDVERTVERVDDVEAALLSKAGTHNLVVIGETERRGDDDRVFGDIGERLADRTDTPVLVVR